MTTSAGGTVRAGGVVSCVCTAKEALPVFPWPSVAWHETVVVPSGKVEPGAGWHEAATGPSTTSAALAAGKVTAAPDGPVASAV